MFCCVTSLADPACDILLACHSGDAVAAVAQSEHLPALRHCDYRGPLGPLGPLGRLGPHTMHNNDRSASLQRPTAEEGEREHTRV